MGTSFYTKSAERDYHINNFRKQLEITIYEHRITFKDLVGILERKNDKKSFHIGTFTGIRNLDGGPHLSLLNYIGFDSDKLGFLSVKGDNWTVKKKGLEIDLPYDSKIKNTMGHHTLKGVVCYRPLCLGSTVITTH